MVVLFGLLTAKYGTVDVQKGNSVAFLVFWRELRSKRESQVQKNKCTVLVNTY